MKRKAGGGNGTSNANRDGAKKGPLARVEPNVGQLKTLTGKTGGEKTVPNGNLEDSKGKKGGYQVQKKKKPVPKKISCGARAA